MSDKPERETTDKEGPEQEAPVRTIRVEELLAGRQEVWIEHNGARYLLRVTRRGRLILTK
jgi:hemin uptake protein HemP